ncbi:unnamed protein product, partial [Ectocarpus fasciculatus]
MLHAGLDAKSGRVTVTAKREELDASDGEEEDYCTPDGTEDRGDNEVSEVGCTDEERQGKGEVIPGKVDIPVKEEEEEEEEVDEEE